MTSRTFISLLAVCLFLAACQPHVSTPITPHTPQVDVVATSVAAALTAIPPRPTYTPYPTQTPYPTLDLGGLFCEYEFCIGHPVGLPFFDAEVINDVTANRSSYQQGILVTFSETVYIFFTWSNLIGEYDPKVMLAYALQSDTSQGINLKITIGRYQVTYVLLESTPSDKVPYGLAASWQCGDRQFGWKAYAAQEDQPMKLLQQAMQRFTCRGQ